MCERDSRRAIGMPADEGLPVDRPHAVSYARSATLRPSVVLPRGAPAGMHTAGVAPNCCGAVAPPSSRRTIARTHGRLQPRHRGDRRGRDLRHRARCTPSARTTSSTSPSPAGACRAVASARRGRGRVRLLGDGAAAVHGAHSGTRDALAYLESRNFTEPAFVFVIMVIAASRPILDFAGAAALRSLRAAAAAGRDRLLLHAAFGRAAARLVHHRAGGDDAGRAAAARALLQPQRAAASCTPRSACCSSTSPSAAR